MDGSVSVLYVDDEPEFGEVAVDLLEDENGRLAVELVTGADAVLGRLSEDVDCIVSDYDMPGTNGLELLATVREEHPDLPFILFTGKGSEEIASDAISAGVTDYLQKEGGTEQFAVLANRIEHAVARYRATSALQTERDRLSALFENAPEAIAFYEFEGDHPIARSINPTFEETFGYEPEGAVGASLDDLLVPPEQEAEGQSINHKVRSGECVDTRVTRRTVDGAREFRLRSVPLLPGEHGEQGYVIYTDITERVKRRRELAELEQALETVFANVPLVVFALDADGVFTRSRGKALAEIGFAPSEAVGQSVFDLYADHPEIIDHCERALAGEEVAATVETEGCVFESRYQPLHEDGEVVRVVGHRYDVTEYER